MHSARIHMPQSSSRDALHEIVLTRTNIIYIHIINVLEKTAWILKKKNSRDTSLCCARCSDDWLNYAWWTVFGKKNFFFFLLISLPWHSGAQYSIKTLPTNIIITIHTSLHFFVGRKKLVIIIIGLVIITSASNNFRVKYTRRGITSHIPATQRDRILWYTIQVVLQNKSRRLRRRVSISVQTNRLCGIAHIIFMIICAYTKYVFYNNYYAVI